MSNKMQTRRSTYRLNRTSDVLTFLGGIGVGAAASSAVVTKLTGKPSAPAFSGDPDADPIVLAAQRL